MSLLKRLADERQSALAFIAKLSETAENEKRDLTANELELITRNQARLGELDAQITVLNKEFTLDEQAAERLAAHQRGAVATVTETRAVEYASPGAFLTDYVQSYIGDKEAKTAADDRLKRYYRAAAHITTASFPGIIPDPIIGPLINLINSSRPLFASVGAVSVPNAPSFRRPRLLDPNIATGVAEQVNQKDELVSKQFTIESDVVNLVTLGGYVNVARQILDWGIASMDTIVSQLAARYSYATERALLTEMTKSTGKVTLAAGADSETFIKAVYDAAALVYQTTGQLPTQLVAGPLGWARMGSLSDTAGRPVFPFLAPANASGQQSATSFAGNPVGLSLVVTPAITDDTFWVINSYAIEAYETRVGQLSVIEPSVLGFQVAYAGYVGFFRPAADGAVHLAP